MTGALPARPELIELDAAARDLVLQLITVRGGNCAACGGTDFAVGDALCLGFLFLDEPQDAYLVALTCRALDCPAPRTAIRLRHTEFLK